MMNRSTLKAVGTALWGPQYRSEMARQLRVSLRTAMRYDAGESPIPQAVEDRLYGLLIKQHGDLGKLVAKLAAGRKVSP